MAEKQTRQTPDDALALYLQEIHRYPRLTPKQEREVAERCAQGDQLQDGGK